MYIQTINMVVRELSGIAESGMFKRLCTLKFMQDRVHVLITGSSLHVPFLRNACTTYITLWRRIHNCLCTWWEWKGLMKACKLIILPFVMGFYPFHQVPKLCVSHLIIHSSQVDQIAILRLCLFSRIYII